jgi:hypothetical protein
LRELAVVEERDHARRNWQTMTASELERRFDRVVATKPARRRESGEHRVERRVSTEHGERVDRGRFDDVVSVRRELLE